MLSHRTPMNTQSPGSVVLSTPQTDPRSSNCLLLGLCLWGLKPLPHRKRTVASLCLFDVTAESLALKAGLEPSMVPERQELVGIYETWMPILLLGKMNTINNKIVQNIPVFSSERKLNT